MSFATKTAGVLLAATAMCTFASLASVANAATPTGPAATSAASSTVRAVTSGDTNRAFTLTNLSGDRVKLVSVKGSDSFQSRTPDGSILAPGIGVHTFDIIPAFFGNETDLLTYQVLDASGNNVGAVEYQISTQGSSAAGSACNVDSGNVQCDAEGLSMTLFDPAGSVHTVGGDQAQAQADTLKEFCAQNTAAKCAFTPTSETAVDGPSHVLVTEENNGTESAQLSATKGDEVSSTDSVNVSATVSGGIPGIVDASVTTAYGHTWSSGHSFTTGVVNVVPAGYYGEITAIAPMRRDTGDFTVTMGNTTWNLTGVYFDSPNPDGAENFGYNQHPLTASQRATLPTTAVITSN